MRSRFVLGVGAVVMAVVAVAMFRPASIPSEAAPVDPLTEAWERGQASGSYHFASEIDQVTTPTATVLNAGRASRTESLYLEGDNDLDASLMELGIWSEGGSVIAGEERLGVRVDGSTTYQRINGGAWRESAGVTDAVAPGGDFLSYLDAARNVSHIGPDTRAGISFDRYTFDIDGQTIADAAVEQLERATDLPAGSRYDVPAYYSDMTGTGELWVGSDGYPLRQILDLSFPEQGGEFVTAYVTVDFSQFGTASVSFAGDASVSSESRLGWLSSNSTMLIMLAALALGLLLAAAVALRIGDRNTPRFVVSLGLAAGLVAGALVSAPAGASQADDVSEFERAQLEQQQVTDLSRALVEQRSQALSDPRVSPLADTALSAAAAPQLALVTLAEKCTVDGSTPARSTILVDNGFDCDEDGLTDFVEQRIGTDLGVADTDGDSISDLDEVHGFTLAGDVCAPTSSSANEGDCWYSDPNAVDSNGDGIGDALEWGDATGSRPDFDADGIPDLFDDDNDDDGVPDRVDLAPLAVGGSAYGEANPLELDIDNLSTDGQTTFVDFQLRPTDPGQLQFALNPMDWPSDRLGQIRDVDDLPDDLTLIPMVEITIPTGAHALPTDEELAPYGITVTGADDSGARVAYLPLSMVTDSTTGERVAFSGRMRYLSQATWGDAHQVRVMWAVQVDNDVPCDHNDPESSEAGCTTSGYAYNVPQVVHRYYDDWNLTGLKVTEEHGADMATIYEDPEATYAAPVAGSFGDVQDGRWSWALSEVLGQRFLTAVDDGTGDFAREITTDNIESLFDRNVNGGASAGRYGLDDVFRVEMSSYATFDDALNGATSVTAEGGLLDDVFSSSWAGDNGVQPALTTAYSQRYRTVGLDSVGFGLGHVSFNGTELTVDLRPSAADDVPIDTVAGIKWTPYCGGSGVTPAWAQCDVDDVMTTLADRYEAQHLDPLDPTTNASSFDAEAAAAHTAIMELSAMNMMRGVNGLVQRTDVAGNVTITSTQHAVNTDADIESGSAAIAKGGTKVALNARYLREFGELVPELRAEFLGHIKAIGKFKLTTIGVQGARSVKGALKTFGSSARSTAIGAGALVAVAGFVTVAALAGTGNVEATAALKGAVTVGVFGYMNVVQPVRQMATLAALKNVPIQSLLTARSEIVGISAKAALIGTVVAVGVTWGFFVASVLGDGTPVFSAAFNQALADTIATTAFIVFLALVSTTVVGLLIVGIVAVIDGILTWICESGVDELRVGGSDDPDDDPGDCFTFGSAATAAISGLVYSSSIMVDAAADDLIVTGEPTIELTDPDLGYIAGNSLTIELPVTSNIVNDDPTSSWQITPYLWFFSEDNLTSSSFEYQLSSPSPTQLSAERDGQEDLWTNVRVDHEYLEKDFYSATRTEQVALDGGIDFTESGVNTGVDLHLNVAYALPSFQCFSVPNPIGFPPVIPICAKDTFDGDATNSFDTMYYDILPATLNEFATTTIREQGRYGLAWDDHFNGIIDADGDGALGAADGGLDPDDDDWDTDNDGLSDAVELEQRAAGRAMSPNMIDTDTDGLTDAQELALGTDPAVKDSDNDGLTDAEEVRHMVYELDAEGQLVQTTNFAGGWQIDVGGLTVWVSSDPLSADSDGDRISDLAERDLSTAGTGADDENRPYHPGIFNTPPTDVSMTTDDADGYVRTGQDVVLTTTVASDVELAPSVLDVTGPESAGLDNVPYLLDFTPTVDSIDTITNFTVPSSPSAELTLEAHARLQLPDTAPTELPFVVTPGPPVGRDHPYVQVDASSRGATASNRFVVADITATSSEPQSPGDANNTLLPTDPGVGSLDRDDDPDQAPAADDIGAWRGGSAPGVACTDSGNCMTVWDYSDRCNTLTIPRLVVEEQDDENTPGIEPAIYIDRSPSSNPVIGDLELLWSPAGNGGNDLEEDDVRGPNAHGFPLNIDYCGFSRLYVLEIDGSFASPTTSDSTYLASVGVASGAYEFDADSQTPGQHRFRTGDNSVLLTQTSIAVVQHDKVAGAVTDENGWPIRTQFDTAAVPGAIDTNPVIASDGSGFLVVWERESADESRQLMQRSYTGTGAPSGPESVLVDIATGYYDTGLDTTITATDAGYVVTLRYEGIFGSELLWVDGGVATTLATGLSSIGLDTYDLAHAPIGDGRTALVYTTDDGTLEAQLFSGPSLAPTRTVELLGGYRGVVAPKIAYNPITGGWLISGELESGLGLRLIALDHDLTSPLDQSFLDEDRSAYGGSIACPAPFAMPVVDLRFEELPEAADFEDSSANAAVIDRGAVPVTATSPVLAVEGAPMAQHSRFAVRFDDNADEIVVPNAASDDVSLAFWYRAAPGTVGGPFVVESASSNGYRLGIDAQGTISWTSGSSTASTASSVNDGEWHFIAVTRAATSVGGRLEIWEGANGAPALRAAAASSPTPAHGPVVRIAHGRDGDVVLDQFQVFDATLDADSIAEIRNNGRNPSCIAVTTTGASTWTSAVLEFSDEDVRGGTFVDAGSITLRVDDIAPESDVVVSPGLMRGSVDEPRIVVVGGHAADDASGVAKVEVSVNGAAWEQASGADSWSFDLPVTDGTYEIRARATDASGNVQSSPATATVVVDGIAPSVTLEPPARLIAAATNPTTGESSVSLSGTASDTLSGLAPDGVEVRLTQEGTTPTDTWQRATADSGTWAIDATLSSIDGDASGTYTVEVRAVDVLGNRTPNDAARGTVVIDGAAPIATLDLADREREFISDTITIGGQITDANGAGIAGLDVSFTPLQTLAALPDGATTDDLTTPLTWQPAVLTTSGAGATFAQWSFDIPAGMENLFQVDLRVTDVVGHERIVTKVWRGIIDTRAPRVTLVADATGDVHSLGRRFEVAYRCVAVDLYLSEPDFACPGRTEETPVRGFADDPTVQSLFPDHTVLDQLEIDYTKWENTGDAPAVLTACDVFGNCSSISRQPVAPTTAIGPDGTAGGIDPNDETPGLHVAVVSPTRSQHVADASEIGVMVATDAVDSIKSVSLSLDGMVVETRTFAEDEILVHEDVFALSVDGEGNHTLVASVEDWSGVTQESAPVEFYLDEARPVLTLDAPETVTDDAWQLGSDVLRFGGTVSDAGTVAAVQIRVGAGPWTDAFFDAGRWRTALHLPDADGTTLDISIRAFDLAGRTTEISGSAAVDLVPTTDSGTYVRPDTTVVSGPNGATSSTSATITFAGMPGTSEVTAFRCWLDNRVSALCNSPLTIEDLSAGEHTLQVVAIDGVGSEDLTPATITWSVDRTGPQATFTARPADPSPDDTADFAFEADVGATFECALDGDEFAACASPIGFVDLGHGPHEFLVRVTLDGVTGTATAHRWTATNGAPIARDGHHFVTVNNDLGVAATLVADDTEALIYRIVDAPANGYLEGTPPAVTYVPFPDFSGVDSFTFEADDGQTTSSVATVTIAVGTADAPGVTVTPTTGRGSPTNVDPLTFSAVFDQAVTGFTASDVVVAGAATSAATDVIVTPTADPATYTIAVSGLSGVGAVEVSVPAGAASNIADQLSTASNTATIDFDSVGPVATVDLAQAKSGSPGSGPVSFSVSFDEAVSGFDMDDVSIGGTAGATVGIITGSGAAYVLTIEGAPRSGSVTISVDSGAVVDAVGNPSTTVVNQNTAMFVAAELPRTGNGSMRLGEALLLLLAGFVLLGVARWRRPRDLVAT